MPIEIVSLVLGPLENNTYLVGDLSTRLAGVVDPSFGSQAILDAAAARGWTIQQIWLTHAHFDHIAGVGEVCAAFQPPPKVGLHPMDLGLWEEKGHAEQFGVAIGPAPRPTLWFAHGQQLALGQEVFEVRHVPGHTRGHVAFYHASGVMLAGDLIFKGGVGRTDLPGGDSETLLASIRDQVLSLPDSTRLLPGHGPETTVGEERVSNPFLAG